MAICTTQLALFKVSGYETWLKELAAKPAYKDMASLLQVRFGEERIDRAVESSVEDILVEEKVSGTLLLQAIRKRQAIYRVIYRDNLGTEALLIPHLRRFEFDVILNRQMAVDRVAYCYLFLHEAAHVYFFGERDGAPYRIEPHHGQEELFCDLFAATMLPHILGRVAELPPQPLSRLKAATIRQRCYL